MVFNPRWIVSRQQPHENQQPKLHHGQNSVREWVLSKRGTAEGNEALRMQNANAMPNGTRWTMLDATKGHSRCLAGNATLRCETTNMPRTYRCGWEGENFDMHDIMCKTQMNKHIKHSIQANWCLHTLNLLKLFCLTYQQIERLYYSFILQSFFLGASHCPQEPYSCNQHVLQNMSSISWSSTTSARSWMRPCNDGMDESGEGIRKTYDSWVMCWIPAPHEDCVQTFLRHLESTWRPVWSPSIRLMHALTWLIKLSWKLKPQVPDLSCLAFPLQNLNLSRQPCRLHWKSPTVSFW